MSDTEMVDIPSVDLTTSTASARLYPSPPNPYTFDLGHLLIHDPNPIGQSCTETEIRETARSSAQALINQLLTVCPISSSGDNGAPALSLPNGEMRLPREKPVPAADGSGKEQTKWEAFAERRGIQPKRRDARTNMEFDESTGEWAPRWGFGGRNMRERESAWLEELDENGDKIGSKKNGGDKSKGSGKSRSKKPSGGSK